jgi:hypothetical protein
MVNRSLSNLGIRLDNFGAKPLKTHQHKMRMVADAVDLEPVSPCILGKCRVILPKCRERPCRPRIKVAGSQELDRIPP